MKRTMMHCITGILFGALIVMPAHAGSGQFNVQWMNVTATSLYKVSVPKDNWTEIARRTHSAGSNFQVSMIRGDRWVTLNQETAGQMGLSSEEVSKALERFTSNDTMVFARFFPEQAELRINGVKVEKLPDGTARVYISDFTPHHGERWKAGRYYLTDAEKSNPNQLGNNPFQQFRSDNTDPVFYNVNWAAAQVALGHAMAYFRAGIGLMSVPQMRLDVQTSKSGGLLKKTVTTTIRGYAKPQWYIAMPWEMQPRGTAAQICVVYVNSGTSCDDIGHVAGSGISLEQWNGGNLQEQEDLLYTRTEKKSGWTVLGFALFSQLTGINDGLGYILTSSALNGGGLTSVQQGYLGSTGWGYTPPLSGGSQDQVGLFNAVTQRHIENPLNSALSGTTTQYMGNCSEGWSVAQCQAAGLNPGTTYRADSYIEFNGVSFLRSRFESCRAQGLSGAALRECAAPSANPGAGGWVVAQ